MRIIKREQPAPLLIVLVSFDPSREGIDHYDPEHPELLTDINSPYYGEQWISSTPNDYYDAFFKEGANLTFEEPDPAVFKCIKMAYDASRAGGSYPVVLNAANEVLVDLFLKEKIRFIDIQNRLEDILDKHNPTYDLTLEDIIRVDENTRKEVRG
jgi:1-deoxy-D-xylulose-5-phosphate reductoisomerase